MLNLLKHELLSSWGAAVGWSIGLILFGALYISIFPEVADEMMDLADLEIYQVMGMDVGSFEGFISSIVLLFLPLLLGIYAIVTSTQTLAGEEDSGTLELVLAAPLSRWQIVSMKALAIAIVLFLILLVAGLGNAAVFTGIKDSVETEVTPTQLFVVLLSSWPLILAFVMIGLFLGAYLPSRRVAALLLTVIFIASYFLENLAGLVSSLEPLKPLSLFSYFNSSGTVFNEGVRVSDMLVLLGVAAVFFALALLSFQRRNITTGAWPWQRARVSE